MCTDGLCDWTDNGSNYMTTRRWYPTLETLQVRGLRRCLSVERGKGMFTWAFFFQDGTIIIIGGCDWGGYVNDIGQNNPTYEFYPTRGGPVGLNILTTTLPANLFPLIWLLPSGTSASEVPDGCRSAYAHAGAQATSASRRIWGPKSLTTPTMSNTH